MCMKTKGSANQAQAPPTNAQGPLNNAQAPFPLVTLPGVGVLLPHWQQVARMVAPVLFPPYGVVVQAALLVTGPPGVGMYVGWGGWGGGEGVWVTFLLQCECEELYCAWWYVLYAHAQYQAHAHHQAHARPHARHVTSQHNTSHHITSPKYHHQAQNVTLNTSQGGTQPSLQHAQHLGYTLFQWMHMSCWVQVYTKRVLLCVLHLKGLLMWHRVY